MCAAASLFCLLLAFAQQPDEPRPATVSGRVVDAVSGRPIPGVVVTPAGAAVPLTATNPLPPRALTNGQGEFVLRGLRKGMVFFTAVKSGYANATYNQRRPGGSGQGIAIQDGQRLNGVEIRMWRHASISGTVLDEAGEPAVGVTVRAFEREFRAGLRRFLPSYSGVTDDRGVYRIANLTPGDYAVGIRFTQTAIPTEAMDVFFGASGGGTQEQRMRLSRELNEIGAPIVPAGSHYALALGDQTFTLAPGTLVPQQDSRGGLWIYPTVFYPAATVLSQAGVLTIKSGEERASIDFQVRPTRAVRVSGTVMAPDGPASNIGVRLLPAGVDGGVESWEVATTITNSSGDFTLPAVPAGQFMLKILQVPREPVDLQDSSRVMVTPGGTVTIGTAVAAPNSAPPSPPPIPMEATLFAQVLLSVGEAEISAMVVPLSPAPRITGRIEFEGSNDKLASFQLTGIRIDLDPADGSRVSQEIVAVHPSHPEEDGTFRTLGVSPGKYVLRISNVPAGWTLKGAFSGTDDFTDVPLDLSKRDVTGVAITFTDRPAELSGTVRTGQSADPDAVVLIFPTDSSTWGMRGPFPRRMRTARATKTGSYALQGLPPGEYNVIAVHEDTFADWQDPALLDAIARVAQQIRIVEGERKIQDLATAVIR